MNPDGGKAMIRCKRAGTLDEEDTMDPLSRFAREKEDLERRTTKEKNRASSPNERKTSIDSVSLFGREQKTWERRTATDTRSIRARWGELEGAERAVVEDIPKEIWNSKKSTKQRIFKVIMLGDTNVGKTCLAVRFCGGSFPEKVEATIGVDFRDKNVDIGEEAVKLQIWDTAGQERYRRSMIPHYYRNSNAVVFVYDMTKTSSFESLPDWISECDAYNLGRDIPRILVGNKCDLRNTITVHTNMAQQFADCHQMPLFETSAKDNCESDHVESIFLTLAYKLKCGCGRPWMQVPKNLGDSYRQPILLNVANANRPKKDEGFCTC